MKLGREISWVVERAVELAVLVREQEEEQANDFDFFHHSEDFTALCNGLVRQDRQGMSVL